VAVLLIKFLAPSTALRGGDSHKLLTDVTATIIKFLRNKIDFGVRPSKRIKVKYPTAKTLTANNPFAKKPSANNLTVNNPYAQNSTVKKSYVL
jgi:hypothetical protein